MSKQVTAAVASVLRLQRQSGNERFGNWNGRLASALAAALVPLYRGALKRSGVRDDDWAITAAQAQAGEAAVQVNDATASMLESGHDYAEVFGSDRAALIGLDQGDKAEAACQVRAAQLRGSRLQWVSEANACTSCKRLNGRKRWPGEPFGRIDGRDVLHPPAHPHCACETREV